MLTDQDKAHVEALCSQLERAQVDIGVLLHNARATLRNVFGAATRMQAEQDAAKAPENPTALGLMELAKAKAAAK